MASLKRYLLTGDCFLNNQLIEAGSVILWDPALKNNAMVLCDAKGRPLEAREGEEIPPVQILNVDPEEDEEEDEELTPEQRANLIRLAVEDILKADDDAHWTAKGEIRIETVRTFAKIEDVSREEIEAAQASIEEDEEQAKGTDAAKARAAAKG